MTRLEQLLPLLKDLVAVDVRGGIFAQKDIKAAVAAMVLTPEWTQRCLEWQSCEDEAVELTAYKLRCALAHVRLLHDSVVHEGHVLQELFEKMKEGANMASVMDPRRARRNERLNKRQHPFPCFRKQGGDEAADEEADLPTKVCKQWDGNKAFLLMSDGACMNADKYEEGPNGRACARWLLEDGTQEMMMLDLPNSCVRDNKLQFTKKEEAGKKRGAPASKAAVKKRPAKRPAEGSKSANSGEEEAAPVLKAEGAQDEVVPCEEHEDGREEDTSNAEGEELKMEATLRIASGHNGTQTLVLVNKADCHDRAQIVQVTAKQCTDSPVPGLSPLEVIREVMKLETVQFQVDLMGTPVRANECLENLKKLVKVAANKILGKAG